MTGLSGRRQARTRILATLVLVGAVAGLSPRAVRAESAPLPVLTAAQQLAIARVFAPTLVYHPLELYFPTSSMGVATIEPWPARVEQYRALSAQEKMDRATLAYRVFPRLEDGQIEVIVEYRCYYVYNAYTIRGAWLPYRASDNHPHDLERLYVVLEAGRSRVARRRRRRRCVGARGVPDCPRRRERARREHSAESVPRG